MFIPEYNTPSQRKRVDIEAELDIVRECSFNADRGTDTTGPDNDMLPIIHDPLQRRNQISSVTATSNIRGTELE